MEKRYRIPTSGLKNKRVPSHYTDPVDHPTGSLEKAKEIAKQKTEESNMKTLIPRLTKKIVSVVAALTGISFGSAISVGEVITGEIIIDAIIIVGAIIIILINGKDGVPDWLVHAVGKRTREEESK